MDDGYGRVLTVDTEEESCKSVIIYNEPFR